jgi:hypothetical protein
MPQTWWPSPRAHFGQPLLCRTVRFNSMPRSNSPVTGNLLTGLWRARRICSRIIHKNETSAAASINHNFVQPCRIPPSRGFCDTHNSIEFCAEKWLEPLM